MNAMYELLDFVESEMEELAKRIRKGGGNDTVYQRMDWLSHTLKSLECVIAMREASEDEDGYNSRNSRDSGGGNSGRRSWRRGRSHDGGGTSGGNSYDHDAGKDQMIQAARRFLSEVENA